jgi:hypothetical protein
MNTIKKFAIPVLWIGFFSAIHLLSSAQEKENHTFRYFSPEPGSRFVRPENNIALRHGEPLKPADLSTFKMDVRGSVSGQIEGALKLSVDQRTVLFQPLMPFAPGEQVYVKTQGVLHTKSDKSIEEVSFTFFVSESLPELPGDYSLQQELALHRLFHPNRHPDYTPVQKNSVENGLPEDFPDLSVEVLNETNDNGYYFVSPFGYWGWFPENIPYLIVFDDHGVPVFYQRLEQHGYDFKLNENGMLSYFFNAWPNAYYPVMNASAEHVDTFTMKNGYASDFHEFFMLENGNAVLMAYDPQIVDMSQVVPGGVEDAIVTGWVFQEQDPEKNVVYQWRSWDHYDILDAEGYVNLTASTIDLIHGNAIEITPDGESLLLSPRNLNEITKVDRNTGEIIWRLEGNNNMFEFIGDTLGFSWQHDCRILANGNLSIFDNGTYHPDPKYSSIIEYAIDEENMTATLIRRLRNQPDIFGEIMGSGRELQNGNMLSGWGSGIPGVTEFDADGNVAATYYFSGINYRAHRAPWETDYFETNKGMLHFGYIWMEDQLTLPVSVINNQDHDVELSGYHTRTDHFTVEETFPITLPAGGEITLNVTFTPTSSGDYSDVLTINSDINSDTLVRRIARQVTLSGNATVGQRVSDEKTLKVVASPNPVRDVLSLSFNGNQESVQVTLWDGTGKKVKQKVYRDLSECRISMEEVPSGLCMIELRNLADQSVAILKIMKK